MVNILIVDDDPEIIYMYQMIFKNYKEYQIVGIAENGQEAVDKFKDCREKIHVVIMDYRLPVKDGLQATKEIL